MDRRREGPPPPNRAGEGEDPGPARRLSNSRARVDEARVAAGGDPQRPETSFGTASKVRSTSQRVRAVITFFSSGVAWS